MNLIKSRKIGKEVWYSLADNHVKEVFDVSLEHIMETEND
jgi:ArsR family transcriptional regulator